MVYFCTGRRYNSGSSMYYVQFAFRMIPVHVFIMFTHRWKLPVLVPMDSSNRRRRSDCRIPQRMT